MTNFSVNYGRVLATDAVLATSLIPIAASITTWARLEVNPYTADLSQGLQAPVADPLWMLLRQWQFTEFQGEDAGSPIAVKLTGETARLSRYAPAQQGDAATDYQHLDLPLEVVVEREAIRAAHPRLAAEAGEHFLRLAAAAGVTGLRSQLRADFALDIADTALPAPDADPKGKTWQALFAGRAIDGHRLAAALRSFVDAAGELTGLPATFDGVSVPDLLPPAARWLRWYDQHVSEPAATEQSAWVPPRQEYTLALGADFGGDAITLAADEYTDGQLDWYSFTAARTPDLGAAAQPAAVEPLDFTPMLPAPVRYPGMPADRYWEFEDARVSFGSLEAGPTDLGRMLLAEYGLVYSNDWFLIPVELPVGSVFRVKSLTVRDTFGVTATVNPSRNLDGTRWTMFSLTSRPNLPRSLQDVFFLPPTLPTHLEGDPLETITWFRDEMANLVWAVEHTVQGASGQPMERQMEPPTPTARQQLDATEITAELIYRLMTPVADQWLPFVPVPTGQIATIALERRTLLRTLPDGSRREVHPRGLLLRTDLSRSIEDEPPLRLHEEEVPREGVQVTRSFQYTRWLDGKRYLWVGRRKRIGRGEGSSGLRFDASLYTAEYTAPMAHQAPINDRRL